jgi:hypothetical protein
VFGSYGFTATRSLVCRQAKYGGLSVYRNGSSSLSSGTPLCHAILAGVDSPDMDAAKLREHASFKSQRQCARQSFNNEDIRKIGRGSHITANGRQVLGGKLGVVLIHMTAAGRALSLEATFGKDRAQAQDLFRLASLARWGLDYAPAAPSPLQGGGDAER